MFNIWLLGKSILPQVDSMHQHFTVHTNPDLFMSQKRCEKISSNGQEYIWTRVILLEISMPNKHMDSNKTHKQNTQLHFTKKLDLSCCSI